MPLKDKEKRNAYARARWHKVGNAARRQRKADWHKSPKSWRGKREALLKEQGGRCAACDRDDPQTKSGWALDHCHTASPGKRPTNAKIRGVLCGPCNVTLGFMRDSVDRLISLALYLEHHK